MTVVVRLLGAPSVETDGAPTTPPRGRKSWALLSLLVLSRASTDPPTPRLAALPGCRRPLGALRWSLADLRRSLRPYAEIAGDPVRLTLADGVTTDVALVARWVRARLDGDRRRATCSRAWSFDGCPGFETWLLVERRRLASTYEALLHEEALRHLAAGRHGSGRRRARAGS